MLTTHKNTICNKENEGIKDSASNYLIQQGFDADPVKQSSGNNPLPIKCPGIKK
jgi:putative hemolysin